MILRRLVKRVMDAMGMTEAPPPARTAPTLSAEPPRGVVVGNAMSNIPGSGPSDVAQAMARPSDGRNRFNR